MTADLFDIVSSNSEIDHPLCEECTDTLLELMDQQLRLTEDELNDYSQFLKRYELFLARKRSQLILKGGGEIFELLKV